MDASVVLAHVRQLVAEQFTAQGASSSEASETLLIRSGHYCGRRFSAETGASAIWFIEEDELKFYAREGELILALRVKDAASRDTEQPLRRAA